VYGCLGQKQQFLNSGPCSLDVSSSRFYPRPDFTGVCCARLQELDALVYTQTVIQKPLVLWADSGLTCAPPVRIYAGMRSLLDFGPLTGQS